MIQVSGLFGEHSENFAIVSVAVKEYDSEEPTNGEERISSGSHVNSQRFSSDEEEEEEDLETVLKFKGDEKNVSFRIICHEKPYCFKML